MATSSQANNAPNALDAQPIIFHDLSSPPSHPLNQHFPHLPAAPISLQTPSYHHSRPHQIPSCCAALSMENMHSVCCPRQLQPYITYRFTTKDQNNFKSVTGVSPYALYVSLYQQHHTGFVTNSSVSTLCPQVIKPYVALILSWSEWVKKYECLLFS